MPDEVNPPVETPKRRSSPRRFNSIEEIEREIDRTKLDAMLADKEADEINERTYAAMKANTMPSSEAKTWLNRRDALREKSKRLMGPTLSRLKERIGIMRTEAPKELIEDASIPRS